MSGPVNDVYSSARFNGAGTPYRTALSGADSATVTAPLASGASLRAARAPTIGLSARFSGAAADTVVAWPVFFRASDASGDGDTAGAYTYVGEGPRRTITATASIDANGDNTAEVEPWDTHGAEFYEIRIEAPSAGSVDLHAWEY